MPAIIYRNNLQERIPSVTTIINQWGIKTQPLIYWAWKQGEKGVSLYEKPEATVGTIAHKMIDGYVKGIETDLSKYPPELIEQARNCYESFEQWKKRHEFKPIQTEISLISEQYQFGGTIDCIAQIDGKLGIFDWKTGKEVYEDHIIQIVAYEKLWHENFTDHPLDGGYHIIRIGKEIVSFDYRWYQSFPDAWEVFLNLRELCDLAKKIKKLK